MANYYPDEIVEEIRINNDIVDVVSEYVRLEKKGKYFFGLCPFHKEKTPSFSVTPSRQIFYCYSCKKGGNVIHFIMNAENLDYVEALHLLADRAKIQLPEGESAEEQEKMKLKQEVIKINTEAARFFYNRLSLNVSEKARLYLKKRDLSEQVARKFGIGYSPDEWDLLFKHLVEKGFDEKVILKSGLVLPNKNGGYYDRFRGRIMFPIFDIRSNVIGFGGRVTDDSMPKYMNSPETPAYSKGRNLYALNFAKNSNVKKLIIVEGYMDVISLHQCGIINTVASLGTALTENQGRILKKYAEEIIISYDADAAGQDATMRGLDLLDGIGCNVKVLIIPQGKDPDEFVRKNGVDEFKKLVDNSLSLVEYKIKVLKKQIETNTIEEKIAFLNKTADILAKIDNRVEREMYVKKLAREYEISEESLYSEIFRRMRPRTTFKPAVIHHDEMERKSSSMADGSNDKKISNYERMLLALLFTDNSVGRILKDRYGKESFTDEENRKIAEIAFEKIDSNKSIVQAELLNILKSDAVNEFVKIIQEECNCEDNNKAVLDIIKRIELIKLEKRQQEILDALNNRTQEQIEGDVEKLKSELKLIIMKRKSM